MIRLAVLSPAEQAELVLASLVELVPAGIEQIDRGELTEFAIYGPPGELPELGDQHAVIGGVNVEVRSTEVGDDWAERWKEFHRPVTVAGRICVRPPWAEPAAGLEDIVIDPGRAFGTAAHPTTRMCCELLIAAADGGAMGSLVDLGAGSGVLAILAARLGFVPVLAVDHEPASVEAVAKNAAANHVALEVRRVDLRRNPPPRATTAVANLTADLLALVADHYSESGKAPRRLICSGILEDQAQAACDRFRAVGLGAQRRLEELGWVALDLRYGE